MNVLCTSAYACDVTQRDHYKFDPMPQQCQGVSL